MLVRIYLIFVPCMNGNTYILFARNGLFMRKVTITLESNILSKLGLGKLFKSIVSISLIEVVKVDYDKLIELSICELILKEGCRLEDVKLPLFCEVVDVFHQRGRRVECLFKVSYPLLAKPVFELLDVEVIWDRPTVVTQDNFKLSCVGEEPQLRKIVNACKTLGTVKNVTYTRSNYKGRAVLKLLTPKQKEILLAAHQHGYYEYPRRIDTKGLAAMLTCSKSTLVEHLRRIENKILGSLVEEEAHRD